MSPHLARSVVRQLLVFRRVCVTTLCSLGKGTCLHVCVIDTSLAHHHHVCLHVVSDEVDLERDELDAAGLMETLERDEKSVVEVMDRLTALSVVYLDRMPKPAKLKSSGD